MVREIIRSRCLSVRRPVGGARTVSSRNEEKIFSAVRKRLAAREQL